MPFIPNQINLIWLGGVLRKAHQERILQWKQINPTHEVNVWIRRDIIDEVAYRAIEKYCGKYGLNLCDVMDLHQGMNPITDKWISKLCNTKPPNYGAISDLYRFFILQSKGGWYFDTDIIPLNKLTYNLELPYGFAISTEDDKESLYNYMPGVLASCQKSSFTDVSIQIIDKMALYLSQDLDRLLHSPRALVRVLSTQYTTGSIFTNACTKILIKDVPLLYFTNTCIKIGNFENLKRISLKRLGLDNRYIIGNEQSWFTTEEGEFVPGLHGFEEFDDYVDSRIKPVLCVKAAERFNSMVQKEIIPQVLYEEAPLAACALPFFPAAAQVCEETIQTQLEPNSSAKGLSKD